MDRIIILLALMLMPSLAHAEYWVCYDETSKEITKAIQGDCLKLGICSGFNNTGLSSNCFKATKEEFDKAKSAYVKFDGGSIPKVIDMTKEEKDLKEKPDKDAIKAKQDLINSIITKLKGLGLTDEEVNIILSY